MARSNRIVVNDGIYHLTTRIVNRELLFADDDLKDRIVAWMYDIADFSGVRLLAWCVMENHLHILVHVPPVPEKYWSNPADPPNTAFFSLRPGACTPQRWFPAGDCPQEPRPPTGFSLSDDEMLERLLRLYGQKKAAAIGRSWKRKRALGLDGEVESAKDRYCRRMYNVSQFAKTLKERIASHYNRETGHVGHLFEGRFHSVLVDRDVKAVVAVAAYIALNPLKAKISCSAEGWRWSSFAVACGDGPHAESCRKAYSEMLGQGWAEVRSRLESMFGDALPADFDVCSLRPTWPNGDGESVALRVSQAIRLRLRAFTEGGFLSCDMGFARGVIAKLPRGFRRASTWSVDFCAALDWTSYAA